MKIDLRAIGKIFAVGAIVLLGCVLFFCCFYRYTNYDDLIRWYLNLNGCFYRSGSWSEDFFTPLVKYYGNIYSTVGIAISAAGLIYIAARVKSGRAKGSSPINIYFDLQDLLFAGLSLITAAGLWTWGNGIAFPAYDEVFSAQNAAGIHPFQTVSYYMLPNNHLLFNLINGVLFHSFKDKVVTGRFISLVAYMAVFVCVFLWLKNIVKYRWLSFLMATTLGLQFPVWGFSFQARGYELYLVAEWGLFISLLAYLSSNRKRWMYLNVVCCIAGYFLVPSFLYFHAAQLLFMLLYMAFYRKKELAFWKYQLIAVLFAYSCYLPVLCFSGLKSVTFNPYVFPMGHFKNIFAFCQWMFPFFSPYIEHGFSDIRLGSFSLNGILFFLPLVLLFARKNRIFSLFGLFYVALWVSFFAIVIAMKRLPFERNLIGHYSIALTGILLTIYWLVSLIPNKNIPLLNAGIISVFVLFFAVHLILTNTVFLESTLYEYNVNETFFPINEGLKIVPSGSSVAFSDESFYTMYLCMKNDRITIKCGNGNEQYFIKQWTEPMPALYIGRYTLLNRINEYEIYARSNP